MLVTLPLAASLALLAQTPSTAADAALRFAPALDRTLEVKYVHDTEWDYPQNDMRGALHTALTLRWTFAAAKGRPGKWVATGHIVSAVYRGKGVKAGADFDHDVEWTKAAGYTKGEDSEAAEKWLNTELEKAISFDIDARGAADPGIC